MVWIRCKSGEYLDPQKIRAIRVDSSHSSEDHVEIVADYDGHPFLLCRVSLASLRAPGVRHDREKFAGIIDELLKNHEQSRSLTYEEIMTLMLGCGPGR